MNRSSARLLRILSALPLLPALLGGCSAPVDDAGGEANSEDDVVTFVPDSAYTSVYDGCERISEEEPDVTVSKCKGAGPYRLQTWSGDLRERATVLEPEGGAFEIDLPNRVPYGASWNTIGPNAEWRTERGKGLPYALILRHAFTMDTESASSKEQHYLAVVKLTPSTSCLGGIVEASANAANANAIARRIADELRTKDCPADVQITTK